MNLLHYVIIGDVSIKELTSQIDPEYFITELRWVYDALVEMDEAGEVDTDRLRKMLHGKVARRFIAYESPSPLDKHLQLPDAIHRHSPDVVRGHRALAVAVDDRGSAYIRKDDDIEPVSEIARSHLSIGQEAIRNPIMVGQV